MNGAPSTSARIFNTSVENVSGNGLSFMAGNNSGFFPWNYGNSTLGNTLWTKPNSLSSDAVANLYTRPTVNFAGLADPWGLKDSPIIDDNEIPSVSEKENTVEETTEVAGEAEEAIEATEAASEVAAAGTPWTLAAIVNQQLGMATSKAISTGMQNMSAQNYNQNIQSHGLNVGLNASLIQSQQEQTIRNQELGGTLGSFFGPIGALIGHAVAGTVQANPDLLKTAGSFNGYINPQQTGVVASETTLGDNGTMEQTDSINAD